MPKTYAPSRKREALELLAAYDQVSIVKQLTGIPYSTLYRWRQELFSQESDLSEKKDFEISEQFSQNNDDDLEMPFVITNMDQLRDYQEKLRAAGRQDALFPELFSEDEDEVSRIEEIIGTDDKEPTRGVPGKTYPYPIEEDYKPENRYEEFRHIRELLVDHAIVLATDLRPTEPEVNLRSLALARILDRIQQIDQILPDLNPEKIIRFEHLYNGSVWDVPPWDGAAADADAIREEMRRRAVEAGVFDDEVI